MAVQVIPSSVDGLWLVDKDEDHRWWMLDPQVGGDDEHRWWMLDPQVGRVGGPYCRQNHVRRVGFV